METKFLFPHSFKKIGWIIFLPSLVLGLIVIFDDFSLNALDGRMLTIYKSESVPLISPKTVGNWFQIIDVNFTQTLVGLLNIIGLLFIAFAKEKVEDEYIRKVRLDALVLATYINYGLLIFCFVFFYNLDFLIVMIFNLFTTLIFFIIFYYYMIYQTDNVNQP